MLENLANWKSIRRYTSDEVENEKLSEILKAGNRAPSWENYQPWHFIVVRDSETKSILHDLSGGQRFITKAPVIILACADMQSFSENKARKQLAELFEANTGKPADEEIINTGFIDRSLMTPVKLGYEITFARALEQLSYAVSFMILEAGNQGLGACVVGAFGNKATKFMPELYENLIKILNLPDEILPLVMVTIGYPAEDPKLRPRKPLDQICHNETFGNHWS